MSVCESTCLRGRGKPRAAAEVRAASTAKAEGLREARAALSRPFIKALLDIVFGITASTCLWKVGGVDGMPLIVAFTVIPTLCPNYAAGAVAYMLAYKHLKLSQMPTDEAGLRKLIAAARDYHKWYVTAGPGLSERGGTRTVNRDTGNMDGSGWRATHKNLTAATADLPRVYRRTARAFFNRTSSPSTGAAAIISWAEEHLGGKAWRVFSQMIHWEMHVAPTSSGVALRYNPYRMRPASVHQLRVYLESKKTGGNNPSSEWIRTNLRSDIIDSHFAALGAIGAKWQKHNHKGMAKTKQQDYERKVVALGKQIYKENPETVSRCTENRRATCSKFCSQHCACSFALIFSTTRASRTQWLISRYASSSAPSTTCRQP